MDELSSSFASSFQVTFEPNTTAAPHPRFSQYKCQKKILDQNERRRRILLLQKEKRFDYLSNVRKMTCNDWTEDDDEEQMENNNEEEKMECKIVFKKPGKFYRNQLMLSEWLVEVPADLEEEWQLVVCPVGKRCLVVSSRGMTSVYTKNGYMLHRFPTMLPGGSRSFGGCNQDATIFDCIYSELESVYYILDIMTWNGYPLYDSETEFRFYWLHTKYNESSECFEAHPHSHFKSKFIALPNFTCTKEIITNALASANFSVDGVLFYHKRTHYTFGTTPLVVWLKPYMLPELLDIPVPDSMLANKPVSYSTYSEHLALVQKDRNNFYFDKQETENLLEMGPPAKQKRNRGKKKKKKKSSGGQSSSMDIVADATASEQPASVEMHHVVAST